MNMKADIIDAMYWCLIITLFVMFFGWTYMIGGF